MLCGSVVTLFELRRDAAECRVQVRAECVHDGDDGNRDTCCDEAILDGRCPALVIQEASNKVHEHSPLWVIGAHEPAAADIANE